MSYERILPLTNSQTVLLLECDMRGYVMFQKRMAKQIRAIRKFAKSHHVDIETAGILWVSSGCAAKWASQN